MQELEPGDILLFRGTGLFDRLIRFGQSRRRSLRPYARFTHAAVAITPTVIAEAVSRGVRLDVLDEATPYRLVRLDATPEQRAEIVAAAEARLGWEYSFLEIVDVGLRLVGFRGLPFSDHDALICSELCALSLAAAGLWDGPTYDVTPADLAAHFQVTAERPGDN